MHVVIDATFFNGDGFEDCMAEIRGNTQAIEIQLKPEGSNAISIILDAETFKHAIEAIQSAPERKYKGVTE